jgi:hypothetical protein
VIRTCELPRVVRMSATSIADVVCFQNHTEGTKICLSIDQKDWTTQRVGVSVRHSFLRRDVETRASYLRHNLHTNGVNALKL